MTRPDRPHFWIREGLRRTRLLPWARFFAQLLLGNRLLRCYCTANFTCGKVVVGEKNHYTLPLFPLDWIRVDIDGADFNVDLSTRNRLPFADASQHLIYSAHVVEHLDDMSVTHLLSECHRILVQGGAIRIETPDIQRLIAAYKSGDRPLLEHFRSARRRDLVEARGFPIKYLEDHLTVVGEISSYLDASTDSGHIPPYVTRDEFEEHLRTLPLHEFARWCVSLQTPAQLASGGHRNWMSWHKLETQLKAARFERVTRVGFGVTGIPNLALGHKRHGIREKPHRAGYSVYVEAFTSNAIGLGTRAR